MLVRAHELTRARVHARTRIYTSASTCSCAQARAHVRIRARSHEGVQDRTEECVHEQVDERMQLMQLTHRGIATAALASCEPNAKLPGRGHLLGRLASVLAKALLT